MNFGDALAALKRGERVTRTGWNGKGMSLHLATNAYWIGGDAELVSPSVTLPFIAMNTADSMFVPWLASHTDMLAEDWTIVSS